MGEGGESVTEFEKVYRMYFSEVEHYLLALSKDATLAEELTAQVFFRAMKALPEFRGDSDIRTWLCGIAKNLYLSHLRQQKHMEPMDLELTDSGQDLESSLIEKDQAIRIHKLLHTLPEPYKEVFSLRVFGQLSFQEIGTIFCKTANWACVTYHRARQKIKDAMEVQNGN
jgi:RNA polymerase sigma-70 factor (ECF subfamily)